MTGKDARRPARTQAEPAEFRLAGEPMPYLLKRSRRRRTVALAMDPEQGLVVYAPWRFSRTRLERLLQDKADWIRDKRAKAERLRARRSLHCAPGAPVPWRGGAYPLAVERVGSGVSLHLAGERLRLAVGRRRKAALHTTEGLRSTLIEGYKHAARREIMAAVEAWQARVGVTPGRVQVRDQKRRWGSCSARGSLNFNWRLILAPPAVMDYVIVHELCHLIALDHSPRFWAQVAAVLPEYRRLRDWLRDNGAGLFI